MRSGEWGMKPRAALGTSLPVTQEGRNREGKGAGPQGWSVGDCFCGPGRGAEPRQGGVGGPFLCCPPQAAALFPPLRAGLSLVVTENLFWEKCIFEAYPQGGRNP